MNQDTPRARRRVSPVLRSVVILSSSLLLLHSCTHGIGRTFRLYDAPWIGLIELSNVATWVLFLMGASLGPVRHPAAWLLGAGLVCRSVVESVTSVGKIWYWEAGYRHPLSFIWIVLFYAVTFVMPALLFLDARAMTRRVSVIPEGTEEARPVSREAGERR